MAQRSGPPGEYCRVTGKRKFASEHAAQKALGAMRRISERVTIYFCPRCSYYHYRNTHRANERFEDRGPVRRKRKRRKKKRTARECAFCFDPHKVFFVRMGRSCCTDCAKMRSAHKLESALEEADRIQAEG